MRRFRIGFFRIQGLGCFAVGLWVGYPVDWIINRPKPLRIDVPRTCDSNAFK